MLEAEEGGFFGRARAVTTLGRREGKAMLK